MKSIATSTMILLSPLVVGAAPFGLLRIGDGPLAHAATSTRAVGTNENHRELMEEDMNMMFRRLFGSEDIGMFLSLSMSLSMPSKSDSLGAEGSTGHGSLGDDYDNMLDSNDGISGGVSPADAVVDGASNVPSLSPGDSSSELDPSSPDQSAPVAEATANTDNASSGSSSSTESTGGSNTAKKAMIGVLAAAGLAVVAAAATRRFKKKTNINQSAVDSYDGPV